MDREVAHFNEFVRVLFNRHPETYLDDVVRVCGRIVDLAESRFAEGEFEIRRRSTIDVCARLIRKFDANRKTHPRVTVPQGLFLLAQTIGSDRAQHNMAIRLRETAKEFAIKTTNSKRQSGFAPSMSQNPTSDPPLAS